MKLKTLIAAFTVFALTSAHAQVTQEDVDQIVDQFKQLRAENVWNHDDAKALFLDGNNYDKVLFLVNASEERLLTTDEKWFTSSWLVLNSNHEGWRDVYYSWYKDVGRGTSHIEHIIQVYVGLYGFESESGKNGLGLGVTHPEYTNLFKRYINTFPVSEALVLLQNEIRGLLAIPQSATRDNLIKEYRAQFIVLQDLQ